MASANLDYKTSCSNIIDQNFQNDNAHKEYRKIG